MNDVVMPMGYIKSLMVLFGRRWSYSDGIWTKMVGNVPVTATSVFGAVNAQESIDHFGRR